MTIRTGGAPLTIADGIRTFAAAQPTVTAVIDGEQRLSYRDLHERSSRLGNVLVAAGHRPGDTVAVLLGNRLEYCEIAAGIAKAGLVMVPLNPRMTAAEVSYIMGHSQASALILDEACHAAAAPSAGNCRTILSIDPSGGREALGTDYARELDAARPEDPALSTDELSPFCVAYTSGTTGKPKGVMISHRSRTLTFFASALEWNLGTGRRSIAVAPMYHGAGFAFGYSPVFTGGTVAMLRSWDPRAFLAMAERERAQSVFLVPTHAQQLRALGLDVIRDHDLGALDTIFFNAAALPPTLKSWVAEAFPRAGIHELYGSTEAGIVTNLRPADAQRKPGSVGHAWHLTEVRIVGDDGELVPAGVPGELFSRSPYLMNGYLGDPLATAACTTDDGFLTCGDIAVMDNEGYISIIDRKKDMIISGGMNVYPREIEEAITAHPAVADVAVIGSPDETWGERIVAVVVQAPGATLTLAELDSHLRPLIAGYKIPRQLLLVGQLPRNAAGKVLKRDLRDLLGAGAGDAAVRSSP